MLWDCPFCGTQKILAKTHRTCPQCQAPQDPAWRYFPSEAEQVEVSNHQFQGKDKQCAACGSLNVATANFCHSCGASLKDISALATELSSGQGDGTFAQQGTHDNWNLAEQVNMAEAELKHTHPDETPEETLQRLEQKPLSRTPNSTSRAKRAKSLLSHSSPMEKLAFGVMGCMGCSIYGPILIGTLLSVTTVLSYVWREPAAPTPTVPMILRVTGHRWQRTIPIQTYQRLTKQDWKSNLPSDARYTKGLSCDRREREVDGEMVMRDYCTYNLDRWRTTDQVVATGESLADEPYWPNPDFKACEDKLGCRREGPRQETYTLKLIDPIEDKQHTCTVSHGAWKASPVGTRIKVKVKFGTELRASDCQQMEYL